MTAERRIDFQEIRARLQEFDFRGVFVEALGWSTSPRSLRETTIDAAGVELRRRPLAALSGFVVFEIEAADGSIPGAKVRAAAHEVVGAHHHEHVLVFVDKARQRSVWSWIHRKEGRDHLRTHYYFRGQPGDLFIGKLGALMFDLSDFDEEGNVSIVEVANRVRAGLDVGTVTRRFYAGLSDQRRALLALGVAGEHVSVLLSRLTFTYFLQRNGFVDGGNRRYLEEKLTWSRRTLGEDRYCTEIIEPLLFSAPAPSAGRRRKPMLGPLGRASDSIRALFFRHRVDRALDIPDTAFEGLFAFLGQYDYCLEEAPGGDGAVNPGVLGLILEAPLDHRRTGASYTPPEVADWLCEETIHRRVLDRVNEQEGAAGGARFEEMNDLLLDLTPSLCRSLLGTILPGISILDPACGSGAFLVAALKVMLGIYGALVGAAKSLPDRALRDEVRGWEEAPASFGYFLKNRIVTRNLFGVDAREDAAEVARLRLFLSLVASASPEKDLEPLPNVNVTAGHAVLADLLEARQGFDVVVTDAASSTGDERSPMARLSEVFMERCYRMLRDGGQFGVVLPAGAYKDEGTKRLREMLFDDCSLRLLFGLRARGWWYEPGARCLLVGGKGGHTEHFSVAFANVYKQGATEVAALLRAPEARVRISADFVRRASPQSLAVLEVGSALDLAPLEKLARLPRLRDGWGVEMGLGVELEPREARGRKGQRALCPGPLYTAHAIQSYSWEAETPRRALTKGSTVRRLGYLTKLAPEAYALAFRNVAVATEGRLLKAALIPPGVVVDASVTVLWLEPGEHGSKPRGQRVAPDLLYLLALFNGYPLDWMVRMRGSRHILLRHVLDLPVPRPAPRDALFLSIVERAARLTGHKDGATTPEARARLRAEIDGLVAHLYGLTEEDFAHILKSFAVVPEPVKVAAQNAYRAVAQGDLP